MRGLVTLLIATVLLLIAASVAVVHYGGEVDFTHGSKPAGAKPQKKEKTKPKTERKKEKKKDREPVKSVGTNESPRKTSKNSSEQPKEVGEHKTEEKKNRTQREVFQVKLPPELNDVSFGLPAKKIAGVYDPAWRKVKGGKKIFAHYPGEDRSKYYIFEFGTKGLDAVEVRYKVQNIEKLDELYRKIMRSTTTRFGGSPDTARRRWPGKDMDAKLRKRGNYVAVRFTAER